MPSVALVVLSVSAGISTLAIHLIGARGPALPYTGLPVVGGGVYGDVWPLDTTAHYLAGISLGALAYAALSLLSADAATVHATVLMGLFAIGAAWEAFEAVVADEIEGSGTVRRWFEDTQADMAAVLFGAAVVGLALESGLFGAMP